MTEQANTISPSEVVAETSTAKVDAAFEAYHRTKYFASLDGLRCIAITTVMLLHAFIRYWNLDNWGTHGVSLFFVISGFLITTLLLRERSRDGSISLRSFYIRRTLRIFPLYYSVLAFYIALVWIKEGNEPQGKVFFNNLPFFLTYTGNLFMDKSLHVTRFLHSWSLAAEEQFYLVWPVVLALAGRRIFIHVLFMLGVILVHLTVPPMIHHKTADFGYVGNAIFLNGIQPTICLGSLLAYALHYRPTFRLLYPILGRAMSGVLFFALAALCISKVDNWNEYWLFLSMVGIVGSACIREFHPLRPLLTNRVAVFIGTISYGMYMVNQLCRNATPWKLYEIQPFLFFAVSAILTIGVASISYYFYERRFLQIRDRFRRIEAKPE